MLVIEHGLLYIPGPNSAVANTTVGQIRGRVALSPQGPEVEEYLGIPFAEKPVGLLRYADPVPLSQLPNGT